MDRCILICNQTIQVSFIVKIQWCMASTTYTVALASKIINGVCISIKMFSSIPAEKLCFLHAYEIYILLRSGKLFYEGLTNFKICSEQIEWENILWTYFAAFWLVRISEVFFLALSKLTGIESFFFFRTSGPLALLWVNLVGFGRIANLWTPVTLLGAGNPQRLGILSNPTQFAQSKASWSEVLKKKKALNPRRFAQSKKENLWNSKQSEGSKIYSEDIFPLDLLRANFKFSQALRG